MGNLSKTKLKM